ncbi:Monooxygenase FAD-binding protein [Macrophomina phaseolina MS6]|uniref:Monooxygenase FAD-binding protein n=1 Tax=Macrophomina phaseolina (strain MS6) TaxID=1126212 RepID=K2SS36_MACPH|nr:Monooxygenase FAD-binding protein [Macrophomina phaseolina MS6]
MSQLSAELLLRQKVVGLGQEKDKAWVDVEAQATGRTKRMEAHYIIVCDGANSTVNCLLSGDMNFPGKTWDEHIVAKNMRAKAYYDFYMSGYSNANLQIQPENRHMASRITGEIVDVGELYDCLVGRYEHNADDSIFVLFDDVRRKKYQEFVDPVSAATLNRIFSVEPEKALDQDEFFQLCKRAEIDSEFAQQFAKVCGLTSL